MHGPCKAGGSGTDRVCLERGLERSRCLASKVGFLSSELARFILLYELLVLLDFRGGLLTPGRVRRGKGVYSHIEPAFCIKLYHRISPRRLPN
jgi:hypothetical protein